MSHLDNLRDPHAIAGLVPWIETLAKDHTQMHAYVMAAKDNEGSREAFILRYSNAIDFLRTAIGKMRDLHREVTNEVIDKMEPLGEEIAEILRVDRFPASDEHE
jgi:hypothetical protein